MTIKLMIGQAIGIILIVTTAVSTAAAVCPQPQGKVCAEFFKSDAVFIGRVLSE